MKKLTHNWTTPLRVLLAGAGIGAAAFLAPMVISATPPANAVIGNQATASFVDPEGREQKAFSNLVKTTVAQVAAVDVTTPNEKSALAGNTVYMPHSVINNGNGTDTFKIEVDPLVGTTSKYTNIAIYPDADGNGEPDNATAPLCSDLGSPKCSDGFDKTLPAGEKFNFVVAYTVPTSATPGLLDTTTVKATSQLPGAVSDSVTDKIVVITGAVFSATKDVKVPTVAATTVVGTWPAVVTVGKPSLASCSTDWTTTRPAASTDCNYTTYTISFTNTGGASGTFTMQDSLPTGLTFVKGTAIYSGAGGNSLPDGATASTEGKVTSSYTAPTFKASVADVGQNVSGTISFVVLINKDATSANDDASTTNIAKYWSTACDPTQNQTATNCAPPNGVTPSGAPPAGEPPVSTNPAPIPVADTFGVIAADNANTGNTADGTVPTLGTTDSPDDKNLIIQASVEQGGKTGNFENYVFNAGSTTDTFNITVPAAGTTNTYPVGTKFEFFKSDGNTPLTDTNNDGKVDTGPIAPGADPVKIVMVATLPSGATISTTDLAALFTATSVKDPSKSDYVWNVVSAVVAPTAKVDLTNTPDGNKTSTNGSAATPTLLDCTAGSNCDLGQGPSTLPTFTDTTQPGVTVDFPVYIDNNLKDPLTGLPIGGTYDLTMPSLPPGWTGTFTTDTTCPGTPITSVTLAASEQNKKVLACITPPPGSPAGTFPVDIVVAKQGDPTVTDTLRDAVIVELPASKPDMQLGPDSGNPKVNNGGTVEQPTTLTNTGGTSCGDATNGLKATLTVTGTTSLWTGSLYYDKNANGVVDSGDVLQTTLFGTDPTVFKLTNASLGTAPAHSIPLAAGKTLPLLVKIFAPLGAPNGEIGTATLNIEDTQATNACPTDTATFNATVMASQVRVYKTQAYNATDLACGTAAWALADESRFKADPQPISPSSVSTEKQCIVYKVMAVNEGDAPVKNVKISDVAPGYTDLAVDASQPATAQRCVVVNGTGTPTFSIANTREVSCGTVTELAPTGTLTLRFTVILQK